MTDDPTLVDTATLFNSLNRDLAEARAALRQAYSWVEAASPTLFELRRRLSAPPSSSEPAVALAEGQAPRQAERDSSREAIPPSTYPVPNKQNYDGKEEG